jgi:hypothetical protein
MVPERGKKKTGRIFKNKAGKSLMKAQRPYELIIKEKLEQLQGPDTDLLWADMKMTLDEKMPEEKKKRRLLFWLILLLALVAGSFLAYRLLKNNKPFTSTASEIQNEYITNFSGNKTTTAAAEKSITHTPENSNADNGIKFFESENPVVEPGVSIKKINHRLISYPQTDGTPFFKTGIYSAEPDIDTDYSPEELNFTFAAYEKNNLAEQYINTVLFNPYRRPVSLAGADKKGIKDKKLNQRNIPVYSLSNAFKGNASSRKGWVAGLLMSYNLPVSNQEMSTVSINGRRNKLIDYLPAVYAQYHFNKKWYLQAEFQFNSPQYTPDLTLSSNMKQVSPTKKEENIVNLNKLYYLNIPVSVYYSPLRNLHIGSGVQYSYLQRSLYTEELVTWEKISNTWEKTKTEKNIVALSNLTKEKKTVTNNGNGVSINGNGNGGTSPATATPVTMVDTAATSLKSNDWRLLVDVNYDLKRFNVGLRYNQGLNNYINTKAGNNTPVQDKNKSFQVYVRYNLFDKRKSSKNSRKK